MQDLIVIGGSFAGLTAALNLGRSGRKVLVLDAGQPRNRFAEHSHGLLGFDGKTPGEILGAARAQTQAYPSVSLIEGQVAAVRAEATHLIVSTGEEAHFEGRRLLIATGVADTWPDVAGMRERWGKTVLHCPYCHGYEFTGRKTGVYANGPMAVHQALLIADWGPVTLFTNGAPLDEAQRARLKVRKVTVEESPVVALHGQGQGLETAELKDGRKVVLDVLYIATQVSLRNDWIAGMGCEVMTGPLGPMLKNDERQATSLRHVYAAGDCARQPHNATFACEDGMKAAMAIHMSLIEEELEAGLKG